MEEQGHFFLFFPTCIFIMMLSTVVICYNPTMHHQLSSSKYPSVIFDRTYRRPSFSRNYYAAGYGNQGSTPVGKSFSGHEYVYATIADHNSYPGGIHGGVISDYFDRGKYQRAPNSWGNPSGYVPQLPPTNPRNVFPCPKLDEALHRAKLNFNLAVDDKWNGLSKMEATVFRQDLTTLCNVIRSDFHRTSEKLRKSGQFSCGNQKSFYETVSVALEDLVANSQGRDWYRRLRRFVGAETFHHIVNDIASIEDN